MKQITLGISKGETTAIKGFLAILVVFCHLRSFISVVDTNPILSKMFIAFGYLSVGCFFFLSGYGLNASYKKRSDYMKCFLRDRICTFYIKYLLMVAFYFTLFIVGNTHVSKSLAIKSFLFGGTVIINGWYLQANLILYLLFFVVYKFVPKVNMRVYAMIVGLFAYIGLCLLMHLNYTWYQSIFCFLFGLLYCEIKDKTFNFRIVHALLGIIVFVGLAILTAVNTCGAMAPVLTTLAVLTMMGLMVATPVKHRIAWKPLKWMGKISFELYVIHGAFITIFRSNLIYIKNELLFIALVWLCSVGSAMILSKVFGLIDKIVRTPNKKEKDNPGEKIQNET